MNGAKGPTGAAEAAALPDAASSTARAEKKKRRKKRSKWGFLGAFALKLAALAIAGFAIWNWVGIVARVDGNAMFPSLRDGDAAVVYRLGDPYVGDVVAWRDTDGKTKFGRVAAIAGQTVDFPEAGGYLVDGHQPNEQVPYPTYAPSGGNAEYPLEVGEGEAFVLNDFRSDTNDSRSFGTIRDEDVIGEVVFLFRRRSF